MKTRHRAREVALQILYRYDVAQQTEHTPIPEGAELLKDLTRHFDHFKVPEDLRGFAAQLVSGTLLKISELDPLIEANTANWKMSRLAPVDRSLLRMATYEMREIPETPATVVINEAVELAKQFGNEETPSFINGILDSVRKAVKN